MNPTPRMSPRQWIAWKLQRLAARIYNAEFYTRLAVYDPAGSRIVEWTVVGDEYGMGVFSQDTVGSPDSYRLVWETFEPDWLEDDPEPMP